MKNTREKMLEVVTNAVRSAYALRGHGDKTDQRLACLLMNGHLQSNSNRAMRRAGFGIVALIILMAMAQPAMALQYHRVAPGDTLWGLSQKYGTTVRAIKTANGLFGNTIYVGQRLIIPGYVPQATSGGYIQFADTANRYHVRWGDTLWGIARRYGISVYELQRANNLYGGLQAGQWLIIPGTP